MVIVSATGGSGSSFVSSCLRESGWRVCQRPDNSSQKRHGFWYEHWAKRVAPFFITKPCQLTERECFDLTISNLKKLPQRKLAVISMIWGGLGYLNELGDEDTVVYLIRDPLYTFNSYSGLGWRAEGGQNRIKLVGADGPDDPKWIKAFFKTWARWIPHAENALKAVRQESGYIVRYEHFEEDWAKVPGLPKLPKKWLNKNDRSKLRLDVTTIDTIVAMTEDIRERLERLP